MNILLKTAALYFILVTLISCRGEEPKRMPDTIPDITGDITSLTRDAKDDSNLQLMIVSRDETGAIIPEASVKVTGHTLIEEKDGKRLKAAQLQQGQQVDVWFEGPVMESMPVQATAKAIRIKSNR